VSDWDPIARTLLLRGKGGHERVVPVPTAAARAIDAYRDATGVVGGPFIRAHRLPRAGLAPHTIGRMARRWMWEAGVQPAPLDGRSAHALRRTCASDVMDRVGDIRVVQELLGHQFAETTARHYLRPVSLDAMRDAMEGRAYLEVALGRLIERLGVEPLMRSSPAALQTRSKEEGGASHEPVGGRVQHSVTI